MRTFALVVLQLFYLYMAYSQDLINNGDFEENTKNDYDHLVAWSKCVKSDSPDYFDEKSTSKIFSKYSGGTNAFSGKAFAGVFLFRKNTSGKIKETREYIQVELKEELQKDSIYQGAFYYTFDSESNGTCNSLGMFFSNNKIEKEKTQNLYEFSPQIRYAYNDFLIYSGKWSKFSGKFIAKGGEKYLIIGNFNDDRKTRIQRISNVIEEGKSPKWNLGQKEMGIYVYIDKVSLVKLEKVWPLPEGKKLAKSNLKNFSTRKVVEKVKVVKIPNVLVEDSAKKEKEQVNKAKEELKIKQSSFKLEVGHKNILKNILFKTNETTFIENSIIDLNNLLRLMRNNPKMKIEIIGHTDNTGEPTHNLTLSIARAKAVKKFLVENEVDSVRVQCYGYGNVKPIADNETESGRQKNRRVEFVVISK